MSLASTTRKAVREHPFLLAGLSAGIINFTAAARFLNIGEERAVAAALRRFATELPPFQTVERRVRVTVRSDIDQSIEAGDIALRVDEQPIESASNSKAAIVANGEVDTTVVATTLLRLNFLDVPVFAGGFTDESFVLVIERRSVPDVIRVIEQTFENGPSRYGTG